MNAAQLDQLQSILTTAKLEYAILLTEWNTRWSHSPANPLKVVAEANLQSASVRVDVISRWYSSAQS